jgi:trehalose 6-phosphate phosphatase
MKILNTDIDFDDFFHKLAGASSRVLMLDYDGTLAPFRALRDKAVPYPGVRTALEAIGESGACRLVIVSGRAIEDLVPLMGLKAVPEIWGCHGWERRLADGSKIGPDISKLATRGLEEAGRWTKEKGLAEHLEQKPASMAIHWRGLGEGEIADIRKNAAEGWGRIAGEFGLSVHDFNGGVEIRVPGRDKGIAVETILAESGTGAVAAYLGDDLTDEDAFRALKGNGLGVFVNAELRETAADLWIKPPEELIEFLSRWTESLGGRG